MSLAARPADAALLEAAAAHIDAWTAAQRAGNPAVAAVDKDTARRIWFVRLTGEEKAYITVWFSLRERTLHVETQFMPAPEENVAQCFEYLLRVNRKLHNLRFAIGDEDAVYLVGTVPVTGIDDDLLDNLLGAAYAYSEEHFPTAMTIGYASKYRRRSRS